MASLHGVKPQLIAWEHAVADKRGIVHVSRNGDVLLYAKATEEHKDVQMFVGGQLWDTFTLSSGNVYALLDGVPLPLICLRFHEVSIAGLSEGDTLELGFVNLTTESRRNLAMNAWWMPVGDGTHHYAIRSGMGAKVKGCKPEGDHEYMSLHDTTFDVFLMPNHHPKGAFIHTIDQFWDTQESRAIAMQLPASRPSLVDADSLQGVCRLLDCGISANIPGWKRVGSKITAGWYVEGEGMHMHSEGSLQGGTMGVLIYVEKPDNGGETVFDLGDGETLSIEPAAGKAVLFDLRVLHKANPVVNGKKGIVGCEVMMV